MVVSDADIEKIKSNKFENNIKNWDYNMLLKKYNSEKLALQEYIRPIHGFLSKQFIESNSNLHTIFGLSNSTLQSVSFHSCENMSGS